MNQESSSGDEDRDNGETRWAPRPPEMPLEREPAALGRPRCLVARWGARPLPAGIWRFDRHRTLLGWKPAPPPRPRPPPPAFAPTSNFDPRAPLTPPATRPLSRSPVRSFGPGGDGPDDDGWDGEDDARGPSGAGDDPPAPPGAGAGAGFTPGSLAPRAEHRPLQHHASSNPSRDDYADEDDDEEDGDEGDAADDDEGGSSGSGSAGGGGQRGFKSRRGRHPAVNFSPRDATWGPEVDEYDDDEDAGYVRRQVRDVRAFAREQLWLSGGELADEDGGSDQEGWSSDEEGSLVSGTENGEPVVPGIPNTEPSEASRPDPDAPAGAGAGAPPGQGSWAFNFIANITEALAEKLNLSGRDEDKEAAVMKALETMGSLDLVSSHRRRHHPPAPSPPGRPRPGPDPPAADPPAAGPPPQASVQGMDSNDIDTMSSEIAASLGVDALDMGSVAQLLTASQEPRGHVPATDSEGSSEEGSSRPPSAGSSASGGIDLDPNPAAEGPEPPAPGGAFPFGMAEVPEDVFRTPPRAVKKAAGGDGDAGGFTFTPPQSVTPPAEEVFSHGVWSRSHSGMSREVTPSGSSPSPAKRGAVHALRLGEDGAAGAGPGGAPGGAAAAAGVETAGAATARSEGDVLEGARAERMGSWHGDGAAAGKDGASSASAPGRNAEGAPPGKGSEATEVLEQSAREAAEVGDEDGGDGGDTAVQGRVGSGHFQSAAEPGPAAPARALAAPASATEAPRRAGRKIPVLGYNPLQVYEDFEVGTTRPPLPPSCRRGRR